MSKVFTMDLGGRLLQAEIGKLAEQSDGAALMKYGDTVVLVSAVASQNPREGIDFFPLSCDYEERYYAVGKIPGGFIKREGRPTERAILTSRLIDRPIRPLFPKGYFHDVQVIATAMSVDQDCTPDIVAMIGSSVALSISSIPFNGPTGSVCIGMINGELILNPTSAQREISDLNLVVSGTKDAIMMIEAGANELTEEQMLDAIMFAHDAIKKIVEFVEGIVAEVGKEKQAVNYIDQNADLTQAVREFAYEKLAAAIRTVDKIERIQNMDRVKEETLAHFEEQYPENLKTISELVGKLIKEEVRRAIVHDGIRPDDRKTDEIRPITSEVGVLPRTHGTGLFTRGQTQVLTVATLGALGDVQILDGLDEVVEKRYMHHYNFPPYSVGETRFLRGPGRREIGHGALAERALEPMIPSKDAFPYAIRLVSEVVSSNGSTSQASVCGSTLALMDAGVPIKKMIAGIAMGLVKEGDKVAILSDIQGMEDFLGDMDFKVAGSDTGITAIQMDIKIAGIDRRILQEALEQARVGRLFILGKMRECITEPRPEVSKYAPKMITMKINPDKIREVIGAGGKIISKIIEETGVKIDIENDGTVFIAALDAESGNRAQQIIENIIREPKEGEVFMGKVIKLMNFGAFVEILPGKEGLVHISNLAHERVGKVEDVLTVGQEIEVKVMEIDPQGKVNLSRKALLPKPEKDHRENKENKDIKA